METKKSARQGKKGAKWITASTKANIMIAKEMRNITGKSTEDIAIEHGVARTTVKHMTADNLPAEAKKIYVRKKQRLDELALQATTATLTKGMELVDKANNARHLSGLAAFGKLADTVYRLETNKPTEITQSLPAESHALEFIRLLMTKMDREAALEAFLKASLEPLVPNSRKLEIHKRIITGDLKLLNP